MTPTQPSAQPSARPPGWPRSVQPPHTHGWEASAAAWLLDLCPPDYRSVPVLRRHAVVLARFAHWHVAGGREACRRALATIREDLRPGVESGLLEAETVNQAVLALEAEAARLAQFAREVSLVEAALRGHRHTARL